MDRFGDNGDGVGKNEGGGHDRGQAVEIGVFVGGGDPHA